jgi:hypothetical protein
MWSIKIDFGCSPQLNGCEEQRRREEKKKEKKLKLGF